MWLASFVFGLLGNETLWARVRVSSANRLDVIE